jgi:hypothetical protein
MAAQQPNQPSPMSVRGWAWPEWTRAIGLFIGLVELVVSITGQPVSAEVLAFAGGLIVAPNIAGAQEKRNDRLDR